MDKESKIQTFKDELSCIATEEIRNITEAIVGELPDYFFEVAASSTGKYHPDYALGLGGLVRHVKAAFKIGNDLLNLDCYKEWFKEKTRDYIRAAILLHDGLKHGLNGGRYTVHEHPIVMAKFIKDYVSEHFDECVGTDYCDNVCDFVATHMGQWTKSPRSSVTLPKPYNDAQIFVHACDYLASRKYLEVKFDD